MDKRGGKSRDGTWDSVQWFTAAGLVALVMLTYFPALQAGFVVDDDHLLYRNPFVRSPTGLYFFWLTTAPPDYFPLTSTSFWIEWRLWGAHPVGYHLVNLLLHATSVVVIWRVLVQLSVPGALVAAAIFAVHPVTAESVVWISERKNTLSLLLFSLSVLTYLRFQQSGIWGQYLISLITFLLAMLSKTSVAMMPIVLLLLTWWKRGRVTRSDVMRMLPFLAISIVLGLVTIYFQRHNVIKEVDVRPEGFLSRLAASGWCVWFYLWTDFWPWHLSMIYPRWNVDPRQVGSWIPLLGLLALLVLSWWQRYGWGKPLLVTLLYVIFMLFPVLGFFDMKFHQFSLVADHFQYVSLIGPIVLVVSLARWVLGRVHPQAFAVVATLVLLSLSVSTWKRAEAFESSETLWKDTVRKTPTAWIAHNNLGLAFSQKNRSQLAAEHFHQALVLKPDYVKASNNLGNELLIQGELDQAIGHFLQALERQPDYPEAHFNLGLAQLGQGQLELAITSFEQAIQHRPHYFKAHYQLAKISLAEEDPAAAIKRLMALKRRYQLRDPQLLYLLGQAHEAQGDEAQAIAHYEEAAQMQPHSLLVRQAIERIRRSQAEHP